MDGILPASGSATRMRGLPKFLLPCNSEYSTLIENHVSQMLNYCETVWIPTRPELISLLDSLKISNQRVIILSLTTNNMTETIIKTARIARAKEYMMCMPDTYFLKETPYEYLSNMNNSEIKLALWKIRPEQKGKLGQVLLSEDNQIIDSVDKNPNCKYEHSWGAMSFKSSSLNYANLEMPHLGYFINPAIESGSAVQGQVVDGEYFDCGTPNEYLEMLRRVTSE